MAVFRYSFFPSQEPTKIQTQNNILHLGQTAQLEERRAVSALQHSPAEVKYMSHSPPKRRTGSLQPHLVNGKRVITFVPVSAHADIPNAVFGIYRRKQRSLAILLATQFFISPSGPAHKDLGCYHPPHLTKTTSLGCSPHGQ